MKWVSISQQLIAMSRALQATRQKIISRVYELDLSTAFHFADHVLPGLFSGIGSPELCGIRQNGLDPKKKWMRVWAVQQETLYEVVDLTIWSGK